MTRKFIRPISLLTILFLVCYLGAIDSLSSPSSSASTSTSTSKIVIDNTDNGATDLLQQTATAEAERLFRYYSQSEDIIESIPPTVWLSSEEASSFVRDNIDTVLFDCDGVLYRTKSPCPGATRCIRNLMEMNKKILFVTNNAGVNRRELREKLSTILEIESLTSQQMISSSYSSAQFLKRQLLDCSQDNGGRTTNRVHVIGSSGLCEELVSAGFDVTGGPSLPKDEPGRMGRDELENYDFECLHPIDALVVGHDTDLNFRKLCVADNLLLRNPEALFVATNKDSFDVVDGNPDDPTTRHILGNGATVVALEYSSKRTAINVGKPSQELFDLIDEETTQQEGTKGILGNPSRCLFVGDRLDTDIRFGKDNGMKSVLVMTGVTDAQSMEKLAGGTEDEPLPDFVVPFVGMLAE
mmetsp:Transcript_7362/g.18012  ORF Transcript_7362/g.18012 Transcript_7362/m.18012 type:complete len:412 (+) Transcript_7362:39-1274(+)